DVPDRLAEVIVRAIAKDRDARWPGMRGLLKGLDSGGVLRKRRVREPAGSKTTRFAQPITPETPSPLRTLEKQVTPGTAVIPAKPLLPAVVAPPTPLAPLLETRSLATQESPRGIAQELGDQGPWTFDDDVRPAPARTGVRKAAALALGTVSVVAAVVVAV